MEFNNLDELEHHGVKGMKWGVRKIRGHGGPGIYIGKKRKLAGAKRGLKFLDEGGHLSVGLTKKRQADYDKRDREKLNKVIENDGRNSKPKSKKQIAKKGAIVATVLLSAYGGYKVNQFLNSCTYTLNGKEVSRKEFSSAIKTVAQSLR